jgi:prolyl-tRNA editing enzyme YbaK/EbsC (Cys-tRNA(Pro) deacylase)
MKQKQKSFNMSLENVKKYLKQWDKDKDIIIVDDSSASVLEAANSLNVIPARIAKSISLRNEESSMVIVVAGDVKIDNKKFRDKFNFKARMLTAEEVIQYTGHVVGGVCPFALPSDVDVYLDISMKRFESLFPACGSTNSAIEVTLKELEEYSKNKEWIDVCKAL